MRIAGAIGSVRFTSSVGSPSVSGTLEENGPFPAVRVPIGTAAGLSRQRSKERPAFPCVSKKAEGDMQQEIITIKTVTKGNSNFFPPQSKETQRIAICLQL